MGESERKYTRLDANKLNNRITKIVSMEDALKDVTPMELPDDVLSGKKQIVVTNAEKDYENKCVRLEILYS